MSDRHDSITAHAPDSMTAMDLEIHDLRARLEAAQESLAALRGGDVDAFVVHDHDGEKIYTLHTADRPFRLFLERMKQGAVALSPDGIILYCNNQFADLIGAPLTELLGRYLHAFVAPHSRGALVMLLRLAEQRTAEAEIDLVARDAVGITICTLISASMLDADDGNTVCLVVTDLTEQKYHEKLVAAQEALQVSEEEYRTTFELAGVGKVQIEAASGRFFRVNARFCDMLQYSREELMSLTFADVSFPDDREPIADLMKRMARGNGGGCSSERRFVRKNGSVLWGHVTANLIRDAHGHPLRSVAVIQDITDRKSVEQELARHQQELESLILKRTTELEHSHVRLRSSERMAALGTLSAGLGHDMGNLLLPVRLRLDALESQTHADEAMVHIKAIRDCIEYLQRLSNGLRMFAQDPQGAASTLDDSTDLRSWWPDVEPFFRHALPRNIVLEHSFPDDIPPVKLTRQSLTQAVYNLVQNAGDSMRARNGGRVSVWAEVAGDGRTVHVGVDDNGPGMVPEIRRHCLEPFFTTKCRDISTGLGLSIVHGIVQKAGGSIDIQTQIDHGTRFILGLPASTAPDSARHPSRRRKCAVIAIENDRKASYVKSLLQSLSFDVMAENDAAVGDAVLWVSDCPDRARRWADEPIQSGGERYVVLLGACAPDARANDFLIELGENPKLSHMRQRFHDIADRLDSAAATK